MNHSPSLLQDYKLEVLQGLFVRGWLIYLAQIMFSFLRKHFLI